MRKYWFLAALVVVVLPVVAEVTEPLAVRGDGAPAPAGEPLTLQLERAELAQVLRAFGQITDHRVAVELGVTIEGTVTIDIVEEPWEDVLTAVLAQHELAWQRAGDYIVVSRAG